MKLRSLVFAGAAVAAFGAPSAALALDTDSTVSGTAGTELSLAVATPAAMTFTPSTDGTSSSVVTVTSTQASWTLSVLEKGAGNPVVAGDGKLAATVGGAALANPLKWKVGATAFTALTGTAATVSTGTLVDTRTVDYLQEINATESITAGDAYSAILTYRVL